MTVAPARLRLLDLAAAGPPLYGAQLRLGRAERARRTNASVTGPDGLEWRLRRLVLPAAMRPHPPHELLELADPSQEVAAALPLGYAAMAIVLPFLPLVLLLRAVRVLPWTIEARTRPWGKRFPPIVLAYEIRGREESELALVELATALARGDGAPIVPGAERIR